MESGQGLWTERYLVVVRDEPLKHVCDELDKSIHRRLFVASRELYPALRIPRKLVDSIRRTLLLLVGG